MDKSEMWEDVKALCKKKLSPVLFRCWIEPLFLNDLTDNAAEIKVNSNFNLVRFKEQFEALLQDALTEAAGHPMQITYAVSACPQYFNPSEWNPEQPEVLIRYSFDSFPVTKANQDAYDAALESAEHPEDNNLLIICEGSEQEKRHLTFAIINCVSGKQPAVNLVYRLAEDYFNEIITDYVSHTNYNREEHAKADFFLLAGTEMIKKSYSVQEELFHLFQKLLSEKKQIVVVSDITVEDLSFDHSELDKLLKAGTIVAITGQGEDHNGC